jgi:hypothetical protein
MGSLQQVSISNGEKRFHLSRLFILAQTTDNEAPFAGSFHREINDSRVFWTALAEATRMNSLRQLKPCDGILVHY